VGLASDSDHANFQDILRRLWKLEPLMLKTLFFLLAVSCIYSYFLYPLLLKLIPPRRKEYKAPLHDDSLPSLSLIIAAHNEERLIGEKLDNSLELEYPRDRLELIVASDCSTDNTDAIAASYADRGVQLVRADERKGKEYAQWCAIQQSKGEILVFSDAATQIPRDALRIMASEFQDPEVGAVSSEDRFISRDGELVGEGAYVKYEMWLRGLESDRGGLVGLSGSCFGARREVCENWDFLTCSDFNVARNCASIGLIAITCPRMVGFYPDLADPRREYRRKVRTVLRGISAIPRHAWVLNPLRMGVFSFEVWSHKIMRWGVPWFMLLLLGVTILLQGQGILYTLALVAQLAFYAVAFLGWRLEKLRGFAPVRIILFFVQSNVAIAEATLQYLAGKRVVVWTPSER
jgi:cellulose synthase/poly-beta-1,6-N-acetylglucosamine synthase-like glycosyltransferase